MSLYPIGRFDADLLKLMAVRFLSPKKKRAANEEMPTFSRRYQAPGQDSELHFGFVNCANNLHGMQARFFAEEDGSASVLWQKTERVFEGYPGLIHGGLLAALLDELMANALVCRTDRFGVTLNAHVEWIRAIKTGEEVKGSARITAQMGRIVKCSGHLTNGDGKVCARSSAVFYLPTLAQFKKITRIENVPTEIHAHFQA